MGQVVPFIARVRDSGDWTASERARLQELADRLSASGVEVDVVFGATDEGDPWCVVTDGDGDVLIHVARIGGAFVVHSAVDDAVNENVDLQTALRDHLDANDAGMAPQSATILPFGLTARQGQTFLALVVAASFFYETAGAGGGEAHAAELPANLPTDPSAPSPDIDSPAQERDLATQAATLHPSSSSSAPAVASAVVVTPDPAPAPHEEPAEAPALANAPAIQPVEPAQAPRTEATLAAPVEAETPVVIRGTDGDDMLAGTAANEHIIGGAGNDTLRGGGGHDLLEGGAGDDLIELTSGTVAIGGDGADTFVVQAPVALGHANTLLGVILDFSALDGDRLALANGRFLQVTQRPTAPGSGDKTAPPTIAGGENGFTGQDVDTTHPTLTPPSGGGGDFETMLAGRPLTRVEIDFDGDGVMDGYVLVGPQGHMLGGDHTPIVVTGGSLFGGGDPLG